MYCTIKLLSKVMMEQYGLNEDKIKIFPSGGINFDVFKEIENAKENCI